MAVKYGWLGGSLSVVGSNLETPDQEGEGEIKSLTVALCSAGGHCQSKALWNGSREFYLDWDVAQQEYRFFHSLTTVIKAKSDGFGHLGGRRGANTDGIWRVAQLLICSHFGSYVWPGACPAKQIQFNRWNRFPRSQREILNSQTNGHQRPCTLDNNSWKLEIIPADWAPVPKVNSQMALVHHENVIVVDIIIGMCSLKSPPFSPSVICYRIQQTWQPTSHMWGGLTRPEIYFPLKSIKNESQMGPDCKSWQ